jgi:crotonobetainyl-CoA:carnitine CoA-transferase CaiB-like acyl-CoA transferase
MPSHGIAYDVWAGLVQPVTTDDGFCAIPEHPSVGIHAGPLFGALGVLAGITRARATGEPCQLEIAQSDAAAAMDWLRSETYKAYERPESEVTGNKADGYERRAPGTAGMRDGVRYQFYETADGHILFMSSEREFWENFCNGIGRPDLFERHPGSRYADHARGNDELRRELAEIFRSRTTAEWVALGNEANTPIAPVNTPKSLADDPQFQNRLPWIPKERVGNDQVPSPIKLIGEELPIPTKAPTVGEHSEAVLRDVLGYDDARIAQLRGGGALG